jgi:hypothetical protein
MAEGSGRDFWGLTVGITRQSTTQKRMCDLCEVVKCADWASYLHRPQWRGGFFCCNYAPLEPGDLPFWCDSLG